MALGAVGADVSSVELAGREVGHLVAEDFLEKPVAGGFELSRDADEAPVRIAPAEASRQARAPLDAAFRFEVENIPEVQPAVEGFAEIAGELRPDPSVSWVVKGTTPNRPTQGGSTTSFSSIRDEGR